MKAHHKKRLLKLAAFLEKLPEEKFNFRIITSAGSDQKTCGTTACAIGWTPRVFPKLVTVREINRLDGGTLPDFAERMFGTNKDETKHLFVPRYASMTTISQLLPPWAAPKTVAARIRDFVAKGGI